MDAATMAALNQTMSGEVEQERPGEKSPEEIAAEEEAAQARKEALAQKKRQPEFLLKAYLRSLPKDIVTVRKTLEEINNTENKVPSKYSDDLRQNFDAHIATLVGHRSRLEEMQSSENYDSMNLPDINMAVITMQHDTKSWKDMKELYE